MLLSFSEVEAEVDVQASEHAVRRESGLLIVVRMYYGAHAGEPSHVVPHDAEASHTVDVEVVHAEVVE